MALPASLLLHLVIIVLSRPEFRPVADQALDLEVMESSPGAPPPSPPPAPPAAAEEPAVPAPPPKPKRVARKATSAPPPETRPPDAGVSDAGPATAAAADAGPAGTGICMHDLFPFADRDPSWLLWISMASFRETAFQDRVAGTLSGFRLYRRMTETTRIDPAREIEGLLVTARDAFDWRTFRVVATYDAGEEMLRRRMIKARGDALGLIWSRSDEGWEAARPGFFRWAFVGSGRVLVVMHEPGVPPPAGKLPPAPIPDSPYEETPATQKPDAGPAPPPAVTDRPQWPRQVTCLRHDPRATSGGDQTRVPAGAGVEDLARRYLSPDGAGHWPVVLLATSDPRTVGLGAGASTRPPRFLWAAARAYFSEPVRLEGVVRFAGTPEEVKAVADSWLAMARKASSDPVVNLFGLGRLFDGLELEAAGDEIRFVLPLDDAQVQAALFFLQSQGEALERRQDRRRQRTIEQDQQGH